MGISEWSAEVIVNPSEPCFRWTEYRNVFALGMEDAIDCISATYPHHQEIAICAPRQTGYYLDPETGKVSK